MSAPAAGALAKAAALYQLQTIQKILELATISLFGLLARDLLDGKALTALLLKALVPAVILMSLAGLSISPETLSFVGAGLLLVLCQIAAGHISSRVLLGGEPSRAVARRTSAVQLSTMAPVLSVFAFIREFVGEASAGHAALVDLPSKAYMLLLLPFALSLGGAAASRASPADGEARRARVPSLKERALGVARELADPFNAAILAGLAMALTGTRVADLGFAGNAVQTLASAQTPVLFLLIGMKFKLTGARASFCVALLFLRHGLLALATTALLRFASINDAGTRLAAVLCSQAAASIVGFGQISAAQAKRPSLGYDPALAFEIAGLSFPLTIILNTLACVIGAPYVDNLGKLGLALLAAAAGIYYANNQFLGYKI